MKIAFILPIYNNPQHDKISWLPISAASLVGNIKGEFSDIEFSIIEINKFLRDIFSKEEIQCLNKELFGFFEKIPNKIDLLRFINYFDRIDRGLKLKRYNHYFFSHYSAYILGIKSNLLLAMYLKKKYKDKKIIFGGVYGFGRNLSKTTFKDMKYIDSSVVNYGENAMKEILKNLIKDKRIKRLYDIYTPPKEVIKYLPDYQCIKDLDKSRITAEQLEEIYKIKLKKKIKKEKVLFIPYKFNIGCYWKKCSYCRQSYCVNYKKKPVLYNKDHDLIIKELVYLKKTYRTNYFIFLSNNFNTNLDWSKKLLEGIIKKKLNILWSDSFNLNIFDDELIELLVEAGCFRMDLGVTTLNPELQRLYNNNLQDNKKLENIKKISQSGIWAHINLISNLPYQYSITEEIEVLKNYIKYIDGVVINNYYMPPFTDLSINYKKFKIKKIFERFKVDKHTYYLYFIEDDFKGGLKKRKMMLVGNYIKMIDFFKDQGLTSTTGYVHLYLLGYLYKLYGFKNKNKIKEVITNIQN